MFGDECMMQTYKPLQKPSHRKQPVIVDPERYKLRDSTSQLQDDDLKEILFQDDYKPYTNNELCIFYFYF